MTIGYVRDLLTPKLHDRVLTAYGKGVVTGVSEGSTEITLIFGKLYASQTSFIHKMLSVSEYQKAMDKMEEYRQNLVEMRCSEIGIHCDHTTCFLCSLENAKRRRFRKPKVSPCDVCGNPVCSKHKDIASKDSDQARGEHFVMCLECKMDLDLELDINHDDLHEKVVRLLTSYDRMVIQLSFCINEICVGVADKLTSVELSSSKVRLGAAAASFVSGGLAVAGTLTLLTPAGLPLLVAAIATSGASTAVQMGNSAFTYSSAKEANQLADRIVGWHGLCLGILAALDNLRVELLQEPLLRKYQTVSLNKKKGALWDKGLNGASRATSMGLRATSALSVAPPSTYTSLLQTTVVATPVFGAALSLGIMACDAHNIHATIRKLQKPSDMAVALMQIQRSFPLVIPTSVESEALLLLQIVRDLTLLLKSHKELQLSLSPNSSKTNSPNTSQHGTPVAVQDVPPSFLACPSSPDTLRPCEDSLLTADTVYASFFESCESASKNASPDIASVLSSDSAFVTPDESFDEEEKKDVKVDINGLYSKMRAALDEETDGSSAINMDASEELLIQVESQ